MSISDIRSLIDTRDRAIQKSRIAFGNRLAALENEQDKANHDTYFLYEKWHERFSELEKELDKDIVSIAEDVPIVQQLCNIKGISYTLAAKLVSFIDIDRAPTVSALWRYAGYAVFDGVRERKEKGKKLHYNSRLKAACYLVATSFVRTPGSLYRRLYDKARDHYDKERPEWTKGHKHLASMRKMIKVFLAHLWIVWRTMEGLPTEPTYIIGRNGHSHTIDPNEFGWEEYDERIQQSA
jgi:hypothetical protein